MLETIVGLLGVDTSLAVQGLKKQNVDASIFVIHTLVTKSYNYINIYLFVFSIHTLEPQAAIK